MIAGDRADALEPDEAAELALLADLLADPSTWAEPQPGLEDAVVRAVADAEPAAATPVDTMRHAAHARACASPPARRRCQRRGRSRRRSRDHRRGRARNPGGTDPDYKAQLSATGLAPGAHASADITRNDAGFRITLDAQRSPAAARPASTTRRG